MVLVKIDQKSPVPIYEQIYRQIIALIETGSLLIGSRLPASRDLAQKAGVNRSTVYRAYQELWALGYIESQPGSYSTVRRRTDIVRLEDEPRSSVIDWDEASSLPSRRLHGEYAHFSKHQPPVKQDHLINKDRLVPPLPEVADPVVAAVESLRVVSVDVPHQRPQPSLRRFAQKVIMVRHYTEGVNRHVTILNQLPDAIQEAESRSSSSKKTGILATPRDMT